MSKVRMAVIGAGSFGRHHVRLLSQMPGVELAGICDVDQERAAAMAASSAAPSSQASMPSPARWMPPHVDAAIVATPTSTHAAIAEELLDLGRRRAH